MVARTLVSAASRLVSTQGSHLTPMSFHPGDKLGPYEILARIGEGGMGEVYKATDTRLDRIVAIKTVRDPSFLERFQQEARAISASEASPATFSAGIPAGFKRDSARTKDSAPLFEMNSQLTPGLVPAWWRRHSCLPRRDSSRRKVPS